MDPVIVFGLTASAVVAILMQVLKALGLAERWWTWATLVCSALAVSLGVLLQLYPAALIYVDAFVSVFAVYLLATGTYHGAKNLGQAVGLVDTGK